MKVEASVARRLRAPPYAAKRKGFGLGTSTAYAATATRALLSLATMLWPDNGGTMPSKRTTFTPSSILFRPRRNPVSSGLWWRRQVPNFTLGFP